MKKVMVKALVVLLTLATPGIAKDDPFSAVTSFDGSVTGIGNNGSLYVQADGEIKEINLAGVIIPGTSLSEDATDYRKKSVEFIKKYILTQQVSVDLPAQKKNAGKAPAGYVRRKSDGILVNFAVVRMGFGHADKNGSYPLKRNLTYAENEARREGLGLWGRSIKEISKTGQKIKKRETNIDSDTVVYLTTADKKYHRDYCSQLQKGRYPVKLEKAKKAGYKPCNICHPPE